MSVNSSNENFINNDETGVEIRKNLQQNQQQSQRPLSFYDNYRVGPNNSVNLSNGYTVQGLPQPPTIEVDTSNTTDVYNTTTAPLVRPEDYDPEQKYNVIDDEDTDDDTTDDTDETDSDKYYQLNDLNHSDPININHNDLSYNQHSDTIKLNGLNNKQICITPGSNNNNNNNNSVVQQQQQQQHQQSEPAEQGSPSLTYCLSTTVPQNIAASQIAGRHAPTRNSLRHSRMIVLNRTGRAEKYKRKGLLIRRQSLARTLLGLQTFLGVLLCILALWLLVWAPNIPRKDNTYWSALPLFVSGVTGLFLLGCCKQKKYKNPRHFCAQSSKIINIFITTVAAITCLAATIFAIHHLLTLSHMNCEPQYALNTTCTCYWPSSPSLLHMSSSIADSASTSTTTDGDNVTMTSSATEYYHYIDLSCPEVNSVLKLILTFSATTNIIAFLVAAIYLYLHWRSRNLHSYISIRTNNNRNTDLQTYT